jgi:ketosteroid isomerase-like protein
MTDHPNLATARTGYEAFARGDLAAVSDLFSDDIVWHSGGNNILTGDYEGKEAVLGYFGQLMQETGGSFSNDIHDMLANDEHGVALVTASATRGVKSFEGNLVHVFHMRDNKMTEFWSFPEDQNMFDEFWA